VNKLERADLRDLVEYEKIRSDFVAGTIELKKARRIALGPELTFVFENRDTVLFQVQEMLRAERTVEDDAIQLELDVYNELIPGEDELSATLMIEITDPERIKPTLDRLVGIDEHVVLEIGDDQVQATFDPRQFEEERISAVQYVRFRLGPELARRFKTSNAAVKLRVDHPGYTAETVLDAASRASLAKDL
jgi:hypothetical protein